MRCKELRLKTLPAARSAINDVYARRPIAGIAALVLRASGNRPPLIAKLGNDSAPFQPCRAPRFPTAPLVGPGLRAKPSQRTAPITDESWRAYAGQIALPSAGGIVPFVGKTDATSFTEPCNKWRGGIRPPEIAINNAPFRY